MLLRIRMCGSQFHIRVYENLSPCHRATLAWVMWRWCVYVMPQQGNSVAAIVEECAMGLAASIPPSAARTLALIEERASNRA